jgi:hypothetical protein
MPPAGVLMFCPRWGCRLAPAGGSGTLPPAGALPVIAPVGGLPLNNIPARGELRQASSDRCHDTDLNCPRTTRWSPCESRVVGSAHRSNRVDQL